MIPNRYNRENIVEALRNPWIIAGELNKICTNINRHFYKLKDKDCTKIHEKGWDNLIILDACRCDVFSKINEIDGELECIQSCGSSTKEFINENFKSKKFHDCVYVSANGHAGNLSEDIFHDVFHVYEQKWDDDLQTVPPDAVVDSALQANEEYPNKRLIIHFIQPHAPFIGEFGRTLPHTNVGSNGKVRTIWTNLQYRITSTSMEEAKKGYIENLSVVLDEVKGLLPDLTGKSVITSDHGELIGERLWPIPVRGYGHPTGVYKKELVRVPWLIIRNNERKYVESEQPKNQSAPDQKVVNDRLRDLGYIT